METLKDFLASMSHPWLFMLTSARFLPGTIARLLRTRDFSTLLSPSALNEAWFGDFWAHVGPQVKTAAERRVAPLLEGRVEGGQVKAEAVGKPIGGVVLEIGAGSGMWADVFAGVRARLADGSGAGEGEDGQEQLQRVYGVEPNAHSAAALTRRVQALGLQDLYTVVPVGIEQLDDPDAWAGRIEPGSVDCIVTILCLCSIPEPETNIRLLYDYLKKGGRWYAYEHVKVERGGYALRFYQCESDISHLFRNGANA